MIRDPIADLVHRYADAVVHRDIEQWGSTWAGDAVWGLGAGHRVEGKPAILELWHGALAGFDAVVQTVLNGTWQLDEGVGTGTGRWYIQEHWQRRSGDRGILVAHYDDRYRRVEGRWLFAGRELVVHYNGPPDLSGEFPNAWGPAE